MERFYRERRGEGATAKAEVLGEKGTGGCAGTNFVGVLRLAALAQDDNFLLTSKKTNAGVLRLPLDQLGVAQDDSISHPSTRRADGQFYESKGAAGESCILQRMVGEVGVVL
jgi:hypothetical protein